MLNKKNILLIFMIISGIPNTTHTFFKVDEKQKKELINHIQEMGGTIAYSFGLAVATPLLIMGIHYLVDAKYPKKDDKRKNYGCKAAIDLSIGGTIAYLCVQKLGLFGESDSEPPSR